MSRRPLLQTREPGRAVQFIHELAEPFRFSWVHSPPRADIRITGVKLEKFNLFGVYHGAPVLIRSAPLRSHYIVIPVQGDVLGMVQGDELRAVPGEALLYPAGSCLHAHWSEHCVALVLAIRKEVLTAAARVQVPALEPSPALLRKLVFHTGPGRSFANLLACLCAENDSARDGNAVPNVREGLQDLLLSSLVHMHAHLWPSGLERASSCRRRSGMARAVDHLQTNAHRAVSTAELARVACLSLRSLQSGFAECFEVGPVTYARRLRLGRAREELLHSDPRDIQLANLAARWGFPSAGAFTRVYRQCYGELPSQTLKQARRSLKRGVAQSLHQAEN